MASIKGCLTAAAVGVVALVGVSVGAVWYSSSSYLGTRWKVPAERVSVPTDSASVAYGGHVAALRGCTGCHAENLGGASFMDSPLMMRLWASNLTRGRGGVGARYTDGDWVRAIRHGIRPDSTPLLFMPSQQYNQLDDRDLGALIAWLKSAAPVDNTWPRPNVGPMGRLLFLGGKFPLIPAMLFNHSTARAPDVPPGATVAYGRYLARACAGCHGDGFSGGPTPGAQPGMLPARNITPDSATGIGKWTLEDFRTALRTGMLPEKVLMDSLAMPIPATRHYTDTESAALFAYFMSLPAVPYGHR